VSANGDRTPSQPKAAAVGWETVHVFISSTFNDMHGERDYLVKHVFPELRDWCEERKLRLVDIDLRWGVTETDATRNKNVVQVCLDRIDRARPFFICFLGQRHGWVPKDKEIARQTFKDFAGLDEAVAIARR
jgi:telomerase protein component 1